MQTPVLFFKEEKTVNRYKNEGTLATAYESKYKMYKKFNQDILINSTHKFFPTKSPLVTSIA